MKHQAKKRLGQHFLHDPIVIEKIVRLIDPQESDVILEIGPGPGVLTRQLLAQVSHLYAVEVDQDMADHLRNEFTADQLTLFHQDVLKFSLDNIPHPDAKLKVVGNLPYNISTPILFHLIKSIEQIQEMHFMLQKEVVDRMAAGPGSKNYGRLSVMLQYYCKVEPAFNIGAGAFKPKPKVQSRMVTLRPYTKTEPVALDEKDFATIVKMAFEQRRKMLRKSLQPALSAEQIDTANVSSESRPEQLSLDQFVDLANSFTTGKKNR
jgi:16S rRNA (adenine1518-N6/adenine1519-N6)-dimethyltransferase